MGQSLAMKLPGYQVKKGQYLAPAFVHTIFNLLLVDKVQKRKFKLLYVLMSVKKKKTERKPPAFSMCFVQARNGRMESSCSCFC